MPCEYTDMQPFVMHHFQGCKASLESLCINFGGELSTITTLLFAMLYVLLNNLVHSLIFHWVYMIFFIQQFWIFQQIRMIDTLVHSFPFNFHDFVSLTNSNFSTNLDYLMFAIYTILFFTFKILYNQRNQIQTICTFKFCFLQIRTICTSKFCFLQIQMICTSNVHNN